MTYKEFKRQIEELGYKLSGTDADITVIVDGFQAILVSKHNHSALQTTSGIFNIHGKDRSHLLMTAAELAETPYKHWREEEEYHWKINSNGVYIGRSYVNIDTEMDFWYLGTISESEKTKTKFTESEYKAYQEALDIHIPVIRQKVNKTLRCLF